MAPKRPPSPSKDSPAAPPPLPARPPSPRCPSDPDPRVPAPTLVPDPRRKMRPPPSRRRYPDLDPWEDGACGTLSEQKPNEQRRILFDKHWHARSVRLSPDNTSASVRHELVGGFLLSKQPLKRQHLGRYFEIRIDETDTTRWSDGLGIGVAAKPSPTDPAVQPDKLGTFEGYACELLPMNWMLGYDGRGKFCGASRYLHGKELPHADGMWRPANLQAGDVVSILNTPEGSLLLFVNGELRIFTTSCKIPWNAQLYAVLDLDGCTHSVHILDNNGSPSQAVQDVLAAIREEELREERLRLEPESPKALKGL